MGLTRTHQPHRNGVTETAAKRDAGDPLPRAEIHKSRLGVALWLVPLGAALLCAWFVYRDFIGTGPAITIYFDNADGLEAKNTPLRVHGVTVGEIKAIELDQDNHRAKITARLLGSAKSIARQGSAFWIVQPELSVGSISGLGTIVSGQYIAVRPGDGPATNTFTGVEKEPISLQPGALEFQLVTTNLGSLHEQTPVFYRGIQVGEITYFQLGSDARNVLVHGQIWPEYAPLVRPESRFWNAGGLDLHVSLFRGIEVNTFSPKTLLSGGVEFATPPVSTLPGSNGLSFFLYEKPDPKWKTWTPAIELHLPQEASHTNTLAEAYVKK